MKPEICIYHGGCDDGFGAAYAVWKAFDNKIEFIPGVHQSPPPIEKLEGKKVLIVDFSYKLEVVESLLEVVDSLLILDHHKTAEVELRELLAKGKISGEFDMERSGAVMAWQYFHDSEPPPLLQNIQDRDLWRFDLKDTRLISAGLRSYPQEFSVWDEFMFNTTQLRQDGIAIERYYRKLVNDAKPHSWFEVIGGYKVPVIMSLPFMASDLAGELSEGYPFAAVYWEGEFNKTYSLRSREGGIDVSEIAKKYGGGGHKHAAGFKVDK